MHNRHMLARKSELNSYHSAGAFLVFIFCLGNVYSNLTDFVHVYVWNSATTMIEKINIQNDKWKVSERREVHIMLNMNLLIHGTSTEHVENWQVTGTH